MRITSITNQGCTIDGDCNDKDSTIYLDQLVDKLAEDRVRRVIEPILAVEYMDRCDADQGHLVIFDRSKGKAWEEKIFKRMEEYQGKKIVIWGM